MSSTAALSPPAESLLNIDPQEFQQSFGRRPFVIQHRLTEHPLFEMSRLLELAKFLPEDRVEFNAGNIPVSVDPHLTPRTGLSAEETIRRISECNSWLVLKNVEKHPDYSEMLRRCLVEVESLGHSDARLIDHREAFIFISSPNAVTPYHIDPEWNFLLQIRGLKYMTVFPADDRSLLTEVELERFYSGAHRNLVFQDSFAVKGQRFELHPGEGLHVPVTAPHWVQNGPDVSISFSITFQTRVSERRGIVYRVNHSLRERGWKPTPVGQSPWRDTMKYMGYRLMRRVRKTLTGKVE